MCCLGESAHFRPAVSVSTGQHANCRVLHGVGMRDIVNHHPECCFKSIFTFEVAFVVSSIQSEDLVSDDYTYMLIRIWKRWYYNSVFWNAWDSSRTEYSAMPFRRYHKRLVTVIRLPGILIHAKFSCSRRIGYKLLSAVGTLVRLAFGTRFLAARTCPAGP